MMKKKGRLARMYFILLLNQQVFSKDQKTRQSIFGSVCPTKCSQKVEIE